MTTQFEHCIGRLRDGISLNIEQAYDACIALFNEEIDHDNIVLFLQLLANKGESTDEILGFIKAMRERMTPITFDQQHIVDICGTGGSLPNRFNVSTCAAMVMGALGFYVAKHGNRGSKKANGSFDFLDAMGIPYDLSADDHQYRLTNYGVTFLFARTYHKAVASVAAARQSLTGRSIFNLIGPFCNPSSPGTQIIGTPNRDIAERLIHVGAALDYKTFAVITSDIGLDEISTVGNSSVFINRNGALSQFNIDPTEFGIHHSQATISASDDALAADNAALFKTIIETKNTDHPITKLICLNAAVLMHIADNRSSISEQYIQAINVFDNGLLDWAIF